MIARALLCVLAAVIVAGLVSTPQSTVMDDALRGVAMGATMLLPLALLYVAARTPRGQQRRHQHGNIRAAGLGLFVIVALAGYALRCHPQLPPVVGCTPGAWACDGDAPMLCSASQRWEPRGDEPCAAQGRVCAVTNGRARCVRPTPTPTTDGGTADADQ